MRKVSLLSKQAKSKPGDQSAEANKSEKGQAGKQAGSTGRSGENRNVQRGGGLAEHTRKSVREQREVDWYLR